MNKNLIYEPRELVKLGIVFADEDDAYDYAADLQEKVEIAIGEAISDLLTTSELEEFDQILDPTTARLFLDNHCPSYKNLVEIIMNQFYEKTKKERLTVPNTVSLAKDDLNKISVDLLFLESETTSLLKDAGFETIADIIQRFNSVNPEVFSEEEGKEIFEMAVMLRYYCKEDKKQLVMDIFDAGADGRRVEKGCTPDKRGTPIEGLILHPGIIRALRKAGFATIDELLSVSDEEFINRRFSKGKVRAIRKALEQYKKGKKELPEKTIPNWLDYDLKEAERSERKNSNLLNELIGLDTVKQQVRKVVAYGKMKKSAPPEVRQKLSMVLNMAFVGNPGTAKTTVARILAGIFYDNGLLSSDELIEVGRSDLVGRYAGETSIKTKEVFQKAKGKLLFIDEAYSLVEEWEGAYGDEAINTIVLEMENNRDNMIVIFAGYPDKMDEFFSRNPGLKSRVPFRIEFEDYTGPEMVKIAELEAKKRGFTISESTKSDLEVICAAANKQQDSGNGRFARNIVENAILNYALRNYGDNNKASVTNDFVLIPEDFDISSKREMPAVSSNLPDYLKAWETIWADTRKLA